MSIVRINFSWYKINSKDIGQSKYHVFKKLDVKQNKIGFSIFQSGMLSQSHEATLTIPLFPSRLSL